MKNWIDMNDIKPNANQTVIACGTWFGETNGIGEDEYIGIGEWNGKTVAIDTDTSSTEIIDITHWMPLPIHPCYTKPMKWIEKSDQVVLLPKSLTAKNGAKGLLSDKFAESDTIQCPECLELGEYDGCEVCSGEGTVNIDVLVSWSTIKDIYAKIVDYYAG